MGAFSAAALSYIYIYIYVLLFAQPTKNNFIIYHLNIIISRSPLFVFLVVNFFFLRRYVVYHHDNSISELKGFEVKRRGELQMIQNFQRELFRAYTDGHTKQQAFEAAAATAKRWIILIRTKAKAICCDDELLELIVAKKVLKKPVEVCQTFFLFPNRRQKICGGNLLTMILR